MSHRDPEAHRKYQREWRNRRRSDFYANKECARCASTDNLELDHIDPTTKVSHRIWTWSNERRLAEIAKCQVLCHDCHVIKTSAGHETPSGAEHHATYFTESDILDIRSRAAGGESQAAIARSLTVPRKTIWNVVHRRCWKYI